MCSLRAALRTTREIQTGFSTCISRTQFKQLCELHVKYNFYVSFAAMIFDLSCFRAYFYVVYAVIILDLTYFRAYVYVLYDAIIHDFTCFRAYFYALFAAMSDTRSHMFSSLFLCLYAVIILDLTCFRAYFYVFTPL